MALQGLAEDVRYYGRWMRDEAEKRIGHLYPKVRVTDGDGRRTDPTWLPYVGRDLTVIAWLWARTVKSPNPAFAEVDVPLASTFILSKKKGKEAYVEPVIEDGGYRFTVKVAIPSEARQGLAQQRASGVQLPVSDVRRSRSPYDYIKAEGQGRPDGRATYGNRRRR